MALASLPAYLTPPNFIAAMEGGASAGLRARAEDQEQSQAADRLKLAYDQLAQNERQANLQALQKQQYGQAALALKAAQNQTAMEHYKAMQQSAADRMATQLQQQQAAQALRQSEFEETKRKNLTEETERGRHNKATEGKRTGKTTADLYRDAQSDILKSHMKGLQTALEKADEGTPIYDKLNQEMMNTSFSLRQLYAPKQTPLGGSAAAPKPGTVNKFRYDPEKGGIVPVQTEGDSGDTEEEE